MDAARNALLARWHRALSLPIHPARTWYRARLREELRERHAAQGRLARLSESADVLYILSRAAHDGHAVRALPPTSTRRHAAVYAYMVAKYSLRWAFYRVLARLVSSGGGGSGGAKQSARVREVVNPRKDRKLAVVAARHGFDEQRFVRLGARLRRVWPLLP